MAAGQHERVEAVSGVDEAMVAMRVAKKRRREERRGGESRDFRRWRA